MQLTSTNSLNIRHATIPTMFTPLCFFSNEKKVGNFPKKIQDSELRGEFIYLNKCFRNVIFEVYYMK